MDERQVEFFAVQLDLFILFYFDSQDANMSGTGDHVVVVGAASKGIIQRDFQHHAMVYRYEKKRSIAKITQ